MQSPGGSRLAVLAKRSVLGLTAVVATFSAYQVFSRHGSAMEEPQEIPLGTVFGDFEVEWLLPSSDSARSVTHASSLTKGCRVFVFANACPAVLEALDALAGIKTVQVKGQSLPLFWIAKRDSEAAIGVLRASTPENTLLVGEDLWHRARIAFTPQFFLLDPEGVLVARGWPNLDFLRTLPDRFQDGFADRCAAGGR